MGVRELEHILEPVDYYQGASPEGLPALYRINFFARTSPESFGSGYLARHHRYNLAFCLEGSVELIIESKTVILGAESQILLFPYQSHYYVNGSSDIGVFVIGFEAGKNGWRDQLSARVFTTSQLSRSLLGDILRNHSRKNGNQLSASLTLFIEEMLNSGDTPRKEQSGQSSITVKFSRWIDANMQDGSSLEQAADALGFSKTSLRRKIREETGISPGRIVYNRRMNLGARLLKESELTIGEIADSLGYPNPGGFSRAFRAFSGLSPKKFRNK